MSFVRKIYCSKKMARCGFDGERSVTRKIVWYGNRTVSTPTWLLELCLPPG